MRHRPRVAVFLTYSIAVLHGATGRTATVAGQQLTRIPSAPSCDGCRVELRRVVTLNGGTSDPGVIDMVPTVARSDATGRWYTGASNGARQVGVFDRNGALQQLLGRRGEGPGEYARISRIEMGHDGTVYVYDSLLQRRTVYSHNNQLLRTERFLAGRYRDVVTLRDGRAVLSSLVQTQDGVGYPLHLISSSGILERSLGADIPVYPPRTADGLDRTIAVDGSGRIWSAHAAEYRIEVFDQQGRKVMEFVRKPEWWVAEPPALRHTLWGVAFDHTDPSILWIRIDVPVPPSASGRRPAPSEETANRSSQESNDAIRDTILEALDIRTGAIVASRRFQQWFPFNHQGFLPYVRVLDDLSVALDVFEPVLIKPAGRNP